MARMRVNHRLLRVARPTSLFRPFKEREVNLKGFFANGVSPHHRNDRQQTDKGAGYAVVVFKSKCAKKGGNFESVFV